MRIALVVNATSGSFEGEGPTPELVRDRLIAAGFDLASTGEAAGSLPERLQNAAEAPGIEAVVVAGGDGTIACAAQELTGRGIALGILPLGTMNLLAKDLGIPVELDAAIACLRAGHRRAIDVGAVNGHVFLVNSVLGMPARMTRHREARRGRMGLVGYLGLALVALRHLGRYPRWRVTGVIDGRRQRLRFGALAVVNNDYDEGPGRILTRSRVDGGRLTLYIVRKLSPLRVLRLGFGFAIGEWRRMPGLERHEVESLAIASGPRSIRVMNDGEIRLIPSPLRYAIRPRDLTVIVPEPAETQAS